LSPSTRRSAIFQALAEGFDPQQVREQFKLTQDELQELFQEVADHFHHLEEGVWSLYCDGASRGNPGEAGAGMILIDPFGEIRVQDGEYLGQTTNNVAEYRALLLGLKMAGNLGVKKIHVFADSQLLVRQLNGQYRVKAPHLLPLWEEARRALQKFESHAISHVPRDLNHLADRLANGAIDQKSAAR
jgi:ribonuclease HI